MPILEKGPLLISIPKVGRSGAEVYDRRPIKTCHDGR